jgi:hypothetical protein
MGIVIENLPITEAVPDETQSMKYKLITLSEGTKSIPYIESTPSSLALSYSGGALDLSSTTEVANLTLLMKQWNETAGGGQILTDVGGYTFTMLDTTYFNVLDVRTGGALTTLPMAGKSVTWNYDNPQKGVLSFVIGVQPGYQASQLDGKSTKLIITNTRFGSRIVIPISFTNDIP